MQFNLLQNLSIAAVATTLVSLSAPAQAASLTSTNFGINGIKFDTNQKVEFTFLKSRGMWKSDLNIYEVVGATKTLRTTIFSEMGKGYDPGSSDGTKVSNDWLGTCGITVKNCTTTFDFKAGTKYLFGLTGPGGTVFSNVLAATEFLYNGASGKFNTVGPSFIQAHKLVGASIPQESLSAPLQGALIAMNDTNKVDVDINDMIFTAKAVREPGKAVPEPGTVAALLGVGALALIGGRRRKAVTN